MHHFGEPLVSGVFDFGLRSPEPPHRELLDWLAIELIEHNWSMKHLHRLITTSRTYQLASSASDRPRWAANRRLDGDNRLLWRANVRRLEAEVVRDSLLHVAGNLDRTCGGPDVDFQDGEVIPRRSLYFRHAYEKQMTMLVLFDAAAPTECYRRSPSIIPQQALALANSPLAFDQARSLALALTARVGKPKLKHRDLNRSFIQAAFEVLLCRDCSASELLACTEFLAQQTSVLEDNSRLTLLPGKSKSQQEPAKDAAQRARENLIHTLMNHNDFVTVR
jgi:hypothetical protein